MSLLMFVLALPLCHTVGSCRLAGVPYGGVEAHST